MGQGGPQKGLATLDQAVETSLRKGDMQEQGKSLQGQGIKCKSPEAEKNWVDSGLEGGLCGQSVENVGEKEKLAGAGSYRVLLGIVTTLF